jgi:hypothetical protein
MYETGGMRRLHSRGRENNLKRLLIHAAAFDLSLVMRALMGGGTPRQVTKGLLASLCRVFSRLWWLHSRPATFSAARHSALDPFRRRFAPRYLQPSLA